MTDSDPACPLGLHPRPTDFGEITSSSAAAYSAASSGVPLHVSGTDVSFPSIRKMTRCHPNDLICHSGSITYGLSTPAQLGMSLDRSLFHYRIHGDSAVPVESNSLRVQLAGDYSFRLRMNYTADGQQHLYCISFCPHLDNSQFAVEIPHVPEITVQYNSFFEAHG